MPLLLASPSAAASGFEFEEPGLELSVVDMADAAWIGNVMNALPVLMTAATTKNKGSNG